MQQRMTHSQHMVYIRCLHRNMRHFMHTQMQKSGLARDHQHRMCLAITPQTASRLGLAALLAVVRSRPDLDA